MPRALSTNRPNASDRNDKRTEARYPVDPESLQLHLADGAATSATLLNLSKSGASLVVPHLIAPGQTVRFNVGSQVVLGEVSNAQVGDAGVTIGVRIGDVLTSFE